MATNNQSTPVPEELGGPAEGNTPQLAELGSQDLNAQDSHASSNIFLEDQFRPKEGPTETRKFQESREPPHPPEDEEESLLFDSQETIPDRYTVPNNAIPTQFVPGTNPIFELQAQPRQELANAWPISQDRTDLPDGREGQDQGPYARNDTPPMRGEPINLPPFSADSRPDYFNQSYQSPDPRGHQGNQQRQDTPYPGSQWTDHGPAQQGPDGTQPPPPQPPPTDSSPPGQRNDSSEWGYPSGRDRGDPYPDSQWGDQHQARQGPDGTQPPPQPPPTDSSPPGQRDDSPRWGWPTGEDRYERPADRDPRDYSADWGGSRHDPEDNLNHQPHPHSEGPAAALIRCTKQVFRNSDSLGDVPLFIVCLTVAVRLTDPLFHKHMKYPHTPQQAMESLSRIAFYKDAMARLLTASAKTGKPIRDEFDKFIAAIGMGQGLSIPLTVTVLGLTLCRTRESPKYARVNDVIQSWLICEAYNLAWLLQKLQAGLVPSVMLPDNVIPDDCPGLVRLRSKVATERDYHFTHLYICIYAGCCYTAQSEKNALAALAVWRAVSEYRQQRGEEFIFLIDRERARYKPVVEVCREHALDTPTNQERILNLERLTLPDLFTAVEERLRFLNQPMLTMGWEQVLEEILAEERRRAEPTIKQQLQLTQPQPNSRFDRSKKAEPSNRQSFTPRDRERKPFQQRQKPTMAPAAAGDADGGCPNHPGAPHTAEECRVADSNGVCYRFLAGDCTYNECKYKHDESAKTPGAVRKASEKVNASKAQQKPRAFPMTTPSAAPASAPLNQQPRCFPMTASACTEGTQVSAGDDSSETGSVVSTSTPRRRNLLTEKQKTAADKILFKLYSIQPAEETQADAAAAEGLQDLHDHQPVDEYAGRCMVVETAHQVQELINNMRIDMDPQWMVIVRIPDGRHAVAKMLPEEPVSALQMILSKKVQALKATEPHQLRLVVRGRQLDEDLPIQEAGITNCSLAHLVLPHWGGGGPESGKEFRAELSPAQSRTSSDSAELEEGELPPAGSDQVDAISLNLDERAQAHAEYMTQRSPKRRRTEELQFDPEIGCEVMEPVSTALRNIIASARTNLAAATLETLQVMNLRIRASHAVEDAAVAYTEQMEQKQKTMRRKLWLQTVHAETLETILDEWRYAMTKSNAQQPAQDTTENVLRDDADCPGQTSANHKGDHPCTPAAGEMFIMTPSCALTWCENDAVWQEGQDKYAMCCSEQHRVRWEQEAATKRWEQEFIQDTTANVLRDDADCPGQAAANHKGDHPMDKSPDKRFDTLAAHISEKSAKHRLSTLMISLITVMRNRNNYTGMWRSVLKNFNLFIDRCFISNLLQIWYEESDILPDLISASSSTPTSPSYSPESLTDTDESVDTGDQPAVFNMLPFGDKRSAVVFTAASNSTVTNTGIEMSSDDEMPDLHRLEILRQTAREHYKARGGKPKECHDTMQKAMQGFEYYNGWPKGAAEPIDVNMSSAGIFGWARAMRRWSFRGSKWCNDCSMPDHACSCAGEMNNPVAFPCKIRHDDRQTTLDKFLGCHPEDAPCKTYQMTALHAELAELTGDARNWMKRTSSEPDCNPCMSPMKIRQSKRTRRAPTIYAPSLSSAEDDFTTSSSSQGATVAPVIPTLTVEVPQLGWNCWKCAEAHPCRQSDQMQCSACGSSHQKNRSLETLVAWLEAYGVEYIAKWVAAPERNIALVMSTHNGRRLTDCEPQEYAAEAVRLLFQQLQTASAELQMHVRGDYSNSMLLMTPWETVHWAHKTSEWCESDNRLNWTDAHAGWERYDQRLRCITCDADSIVCLNLMCITCCKQEECNCLSIRWKQNPTKDVADAYIMIHCEEEFDAEVQWLGNPSEETQPIMLAMRMEKGEPPRYTPVQQNADSEMHEGDLNASAYSPHGAESENSPLLPRNLADQPMVERCANPDTGSVHVHRHSRNLQRTQLQQRTERCANPDTNSGGLQNTSRSLQRTIRQPQRHAQPQGERSPHGSPRLTVGYQKKGTCTAAVHLQRSCRYIRKEDVVEVQIRGQKVCKVCSEGMQHTGKVRNTPTQRGHNNRQYPPARNHSNTTQSVDHITSQLQNMDLNMNGTVTLNASVTTTSPAQTARTLHALSATGADVSVTLTTKPTKDATEKQTHTCIMCPIMMPVKGNYAEMLGTIVHVGDSDNPISVVAAFDTLAEVSVVSADIVDASMTRTPGVEDTPVWGVGQGSSPLVGEFKIPTRFRWGAQIHNLSLRKDNGDFMKQLRGLKMVIGIPTLVALGAQIDLACKQVRLEALRLTLELEPVGALVARLACRPMRVLSLCGGGEFCYLAMRDAGLAVEVWDCVELDRDARLLAKAIVPQANHLSPHDITKMDPDIITNGDYDMVILTSPCQPFSVLPTDPKGWDDIRSEPLIVGSGMIHRAIEGGKKFYFASEQTAVHRKLVNCAREQDEIIGATMHGHRYKKINALSSGSPSSRLRRYCTNIPGIDSLPLRKIHNPGDCLEDNSFMQPGESHFPCIVSTDNTKAPALCYDSRIRAQRPLQAQEREIAMGYPPRVTTAYGKVKISEPKRRQMMGAALNWMQMRAIFAAMADDFAGVTTASTKSIIASVQMNNTADELQAYLSKMNHNEKVAWIRARLESIGFERKLLQLELKDPGMLPIQAKGRYAVQSGLRKSAAKWTKMALSKGWIKKIEFSEDLFISPHFFKEKKGRVDADGDPLVRPLVDMSLLTAALKTYGYYIYSMAEFWSVISSIPSDVVSYIMKDLESAYNYTGLHPDSWKYCAVWIDDELYVYTVCCQGLGPSATWFNAQLDYCYNAMFKQWWKQWWTKWVDDHLCFGRSTRDAIERGEILDAALEVLGYPVSDKTPNTPASVGELAGLAVTSEGISLNEEGIASLHLALEQIPKNVTTCRSFIGAALYAHTAFVWDINNMTFFADMMQPMHEAITACEQARDTKKCLKKFIWTPECEENRLRLIAAVKVTPRWFTHDLNLIRGGLDGTCLYILGDSSDKGGGVALYLVFMPDASEVIPSVHLQDPTKSRLLSAFSKVFSSSKQRYPTFLLEYYMTWMGVRKWGNMITVLTAPFPRDQQSKIGIGSDSGVNVRRWQPKELLYDVPVGEINHLCAREKKLISMAEEVAYSTQWPLVVRHVAGILNSFTDLLSRFAQQLRDIRIEKNMVDVRALPMRVHTYSETQPVTAERSVVTLNLSKEEMEAVNSCMSNDESTYHKVPMRDIYAVICNDGKGIQKTVADRVNAWKDRRFFNISGTLYTPASFIRFKDTDEETTTPAERKELHTSLVMVIPRACSVKLTRADLCHFEAPAEDKIWCAIEDTGDMRQDLLLMAHDFTGHNSIGAMAMWMRKYAWWNTILVDIKTHHDTCVICLQRRTAAQGIGLGTVASERFTVIQVDHAPLPKSVAQQTGCTAVLTMIDTTTGVMMLVPARTQTARETAFLLFVNWIRVYGLFTGLQSDGHPNFISALMAAVLSLFGIRSTTVSAPDQKGTAAKSERANQYVRKITDIMEANGDATNEDSLRMYCAMAEIQANHIQCKAGHTNFEMCFGKEPLTVFDLVTRGNEPITFTAAGTGDSAELDTAFYEQLKARVTDLTRWDIEQQDERSRGASIQKDIDQRAARATFFQMQVNDVVSYGGKAVTIKKLTGPPETPVTAEIELPDKEMKKVRYDTLRPIGIPRPVLQFPCSRPMEKGKFIFYADAEAVLGATVTSAAEDKLTVHCHAANDKATTWLPLWKLGNGDIIRKAKKGDGSEPHLKVVRRTSILAVGTLTPRGFLTPEFREALRAAGFAV